MMFMTDIAINFFGREPALRVQMAAGYHQADPGDLSRQFLVKRPQNPPLCPRPGDDTNMFAHNADSNVAIRVKQAKIEA